MQELIVAEKKYPVLDLPGRPAAMLDRHVAEVYGVETKRVNEAVTRNPEKFPQGFMYRLTKEELTEVVANCDHLDNSKHSSYLPQAFSWEGCNMLATILRSDIATQRAIQIVRGFTLLERSKEIPQQPHLLPTPEDKATNIVSNWMQVATIFKAPEHYAQTEATKAARLKTGVDYTPLLLAAPAQDNIKEEEVYLEVSKIGDRLEMSGQAVNEFLESQHLQWKEGKTWKATDAGKKHSQPHHWVASNKSGYNLKWNFNFVKNIWIKAGCPEKKKTSKKAKPKTQAGQKVFF
jgi:hypothetical protein